MFDDLVAQMKRFIAVTNHKLSVTEIQKTEEIVDEFTKCLNICRASSKLLLFNVEDILALPQLKEGKFTKNISVVNAMEAAQEIVSLQSYQATKKKVDLKIFI